ncbi:MAG: hypothetical protein C4581_05560 [Nitrospiraceae bacterium]|nr:MAG: hypothetical protein C4581_05560 [Nitrospiraceae bacterium]
MVHNKNQVLEVLNNINWLLESHNSYAQLIRVKDEQVFIRCTGPCSACKTDCVSAAFKDRMPEINLICCKGKPTWCNH